METKYLAPVIWALLFSGLYLPIKEKWKPKPRPSVSLPQSTWEFVPGRGEGSSDRLLKGPKYFLEFVNDSIFLVQLEATMVYGLYSYEAGSQSFTFGSLQRINQQCCDSQFSLDLIGTLPSIHSGVISDGKLKLYGKKDLTFKAMFI